MDEVQQLVEEFAAQHEHVFFESLLISGTFQRWDDFATNQQLLGQEVVFGVMTTTPEVCIKRILARNGGKPIDEKDVRKFHRQTLRAALKFEDAGKRVAYLNVRGAYGEVVKILRSGGWRP
jgi:thymidylate kinase